MDIDSILYFVIGLIIFIFSIIGNKKKKSAPQQMVPQQGKKQPDLFDELFDIEDKQEQEYKKNEQEILDQANDYSFSGYKSIEDNTPENEEESVDDENIFPKRKKDCIGKKPMRRNKLKHEKKTKINLKQAIIHQVILERRDEQF